MEKEYVVINTNADNLKRLTDRLPFRYEWGEAYINDISRNGPDKFTAIVIMTSSYPWFKNEIEKYGSQYD